MTFLTRAVATVPGDYFGGVALIDEGTRVTTITASSELLCHGLTYRDFRPLVEKNGSRLEAAATDGEDVTRHSGRSP